MAIYKLGEISKVRMCKRIYSYQTTKNGEIPFYKIGTMDKKPDSYISKQLFENLKEKYHYPQKDDTLISCSGTIGKTFLFTGNDSYFQDSNIVWLESDFFKKKYFYYWLKKDPFVSTQGATIKRLYTSNISSTIINLPSLQEQQKIIDIIEPKEELFLKFPNTVRIDIFEHTKNDLKNLIDIIEPLEILSAKIETTKKVIISLLKMIANNKVEKTNEPLIDHLTFEKGKNGPKEFETSGTPFLDVRTLNTRIPSKFVKDQPNIFKGDILLSLDATVGLVDWFIQGFNGYLYNLKSNILTKAEILLNVLNSTNKKIIAMNATGSTIKHASKAKKEMLYFKLNHHWKDITNTLFKLLLLIEEIDAKKMKLYQLCVNLLIR